MCTFAVVMEEDRCFMRSTVRLVHVVKWTFLMDWSKVFLTGLKSIAWYHLARSSLLLGAREFGAAGCCWIGGWLRFLVRLTCYMPDVFNRLTSNTCIPSYTTLRLVSVKVAMHP